MKCAGGVIEKWKQISKMIMKLGFRKQAGTLVNKIDKIPTVSRFDINCHPCNAKTIIRMKTI